MSSATGRSTPAIFTDDDREDAAHSWLAVPVMSASISFIWIQLESILHEPEFDVGSTGSENGQTVSCVVSTHRQANLGIVGVYRYAKSI